MADEKGRIVGEPYAPGAVASNVARRHDISLQHLSTLHNRKNALFAGDDEGGETWAILPTLIECCELHDLNPQAYLTDVATRLVNGHPQSRLAELTPLGLESRKPFALSVKPLREGAKPTLTSGRGNKEPDRRQGNTNQSKSFSQNARE